MEGFACDTYSSGMSFNGYTTHFTFDAVTVPILADGQTVSIGKITYNLTEKLI